MPKHRFQGALEEKRCTGCDEWKVLTEFHKQKTGWDGLRSKCKVCRNIADEKRRRKLGMKPRSTVQHRFESILEEKHCSTCDEWKVLEEFHKAKQTWDGLQSQCKGCKKIEQKKRRRKLGIKPKRTEHRFEGALEEKHCSTCGEWKLLKEFSKNKRLWDGLHFRCRVCDVIDKKKRRRKLGIKPKRTEHRFKGDLEEKYCLRCDKWKVLKEFNKNNHISDGLNSCCKVCESIAREKRRRELGIKPRSVAEHRFEGALEEKHCLKCDEWKALKEFYKNKRTWDGLHARCRVCENIAHKNKMSTEIGREHLRALARKSSRKRIANGKRNSYRRKRFRVDPAFAILHRLRNRIKSVVKRQGAKKSRGTIELLGCTSAFFQSYIEKQFVDGMTWENRDKWHIDHKVPCAAFNMLYPLEQRYCFWYKNHQPMWAKDNLSKHDKYKQEDKERLIKAWIFENVFKKLI